jgi:acetylglutamate kinase
MSGPLVVKIGGAGVDTPETQRPLWRALLEAHAELYGKLLIVHGGGRAVDLHLDRLGMATVRVEGLRVTPSEQMPEITAVLAGRVNKALVGAINAEALQRDATPHPRVEAPAVGLSLGDGLLARTEKLVSKHDLGRVGRVAGGRGDLVRVLMDRGYLPVLSSIGLDDAGEALNLNADDAAAGLAAMLGARGLVLLTDVPAVLDAQRRPIGTLDANSIETLVATGVISGGMIPKVRAALGAARAANAPAVIASWSSPEDLVRLARGERIGTSVVPG